MALHTAAMDRVIAAKNSCRAADPPGRVAYQYRSRVHCIALPAAAHRLLRDWTGIGAAFPESAMNRFIMAAICAAPLAAAPPAYSQAASDNNSKDGTITGAPAGRAGTGTTTYSNPKAGTQAQPGDAQMGRESATSRQSVEPGDERRGDSAERSRSRASLNDRSGASPADSNTSRDDSFSSPAPGSSGK